MADQFFTEGELADVHDLLSWHSELESRETTISIVLWDRNGDELGTIEQVAGESQFYAYPNLTP